MASANEIARVWAVLTVAYPQFVNGKAEADLAAHKTIYQRLLADIDADVLAAAADKCIAECKWFPTVAELRTAADSIREMAAQRAGVQQPTADEAWQMCGRVLVNDGTPAEEQLARLPEITAAAMRAFGVTRFRLRQEDDEPTNRAQFRGIYTTYAERRRAQHALPTRVAHVVDQLAAAMSAATARQIPAGAEHVTVISVPEITMK